MDLQMFQKKIEYEFKDLKLLEKALTHTSYAHEKRLESNEKLEFLGDAILEFIVSSYLYDNYKNLKEGEMTKVRASVVCEDSLYNVAKKLDFSDFLFLGRSEKLSDGKNKPAILADSVEALIAAMYLDSGIETPKNFVLKNLKSAIENASKNVGMKDYKTVLQEKLQIHGTVEIRYNTIEKKETNNSKMFISDVSCDGKKLAKGEGKTKKAAEMEAAKNALEILNN